MCAQTVDFPTILHHSWKNPTESNTLGAGSTEHCWELHLTALPQRAIGRMSSGQRAKETAFVRKFPWPQAQINVTVWHSLIHSVPLISHSILHQFTVSSKNKSWITHIHVLKNEKRILRKRPLKNSHKLLESTRGVIMGDLKQILCLSLNKLLKMWPFKTSWQLR